MNNFGDLPEEFSCFENAYINIIPIPYEATTTYKGGTREGPGAIIRASQHLELYDEQLNKEPYRIGIFTHPQVKIISSGPEKMVEKIYKFTKSFLSQEKFFFALGGEHTITIGIVKAFVEKYSSLSVFQLDAHADLRNSYEGSPYSHACTMRRIREFCPFLGFGIRSLSKEENDYIKENSLKILRAEDIIKEDKWKDFILEYLSEEVYLTIDLDVFDPSIMPAVGTPEPGGLGWYKVLEILHYLTEHKRVVGVDIVELSPLPGNISPDFLAAKLVYKLVGYISS